MGKSIDQEFLDREEWRKWLEDELLLNILSTATLRKWSRISLSHVYFRVFSEIDNYNSWFLYVKSYNWFSDDL
mgnify:CR=1 FL=1